LEIDEVKLMEIHGKGALKFFTARIIINQVFSKTSPFYKQYRQQFNEINDRFAYEETDIEERATREEIEEKMLSEIDNLYWYNAGIVKLYMKLGNFRAIERDTGIPYASAYKTVKKSFNEIKQKVLK
jgi:hypothetical protein